MNQTRTKRILWTIAALLALSVVVVMVLPRHGEPQVIGNISKKDVSEISKAFWKTERQIVTALIRGNLRSGNYHMAITDMRAYADVKLLSAEAVGSEKISLTVEEPTMAHLIYTYKKSQKGWKLDGIEGGWVSNWEQLSTNAAPVWRDAKTTRELMKMRDLESLYSLRAN